MASNGWFGSGSRGGTSFMGSMFASAKPDDTDARPPARSSAKPQRSSGILGQCEAQSVQHDVEDVDSGPATGSDVFSAMQDLACFRDSQPSMLPTPAKSDASELPPWLMTKVDEYITEHFYQLEAKMTRLQQQVCELAAQPQKKGDQVTELLHQVKLLLDLQIAEAKKGLARDNETKAMVEQFDHLLNEVRVTNANTIKELKADMEEFQKNLESYGDTIQRDVEGSVQDIIKQCVTDSTYKFEADLMNVKKSFSSLRLEFNKGRKGNDFKNTSNSIFLLKAMDMKPEERKKHLRTLSEQEEKYRGAVTKAENDLRDHEKGMNQ